MDNPLVGYMAHKPLLTTGKSFSHEEKWEKVDFPKTPLIPNFELLDSLFTHYHMPILKKRIHRDKLILSHSMFLPLVVILQCNAMILKPKFRQGFEA